MLYCSRPVKTQVSLIYPLFYLSACPPISASPHHQPCSLRDRSGTDFRELSRVCISGLSNSTGDGYDVFVERDEITKSIEPVARVANIVAHYMEKIGAELQKIIGQVSLACALLRSTVFLSLYSLSPGFAVGLVITCLLRSLLIVCVPFNVNAIEYKKHANADIH